MTPLRKILFITSFAWHDSQAIQKAVALAKSNQASLTLASVLSIPPGYNLLEKNPIRLKNLMESENSRCREELEAKCAELQKDPDLTIRSKVFTGKRDLEVVREVVRNGYDLVVKSSEEPDGPKNSLFGSVDINLMRYCPCPVLIVKPTREKSFKVIVAAVDRDEEAPENHLLNLKILTLATWLAIADSSELHIVHSWRLPFESLLRSHRSVFSSEEVDAMERDEEQARLAWLHELLDEFARSHKSEVDYLQPSIHAVKGWPKRDVPQKARELDADLIVMGTLGRVGIRGFLMGNTSETILQQVECSGLAVKPPGFASSISK